MNFFLDLDNDFFGFDNIECVELIRPGTTAPVEVQALRRQVSVREAAASDGAYITSDVQFEIPRSKVCRTPPGVGSLIVSDSGEYFTIYQADKATLKSRYRCWCHAPVIQEELDDIVSLEECTHLRDETDAPYESWTPVETNIRGKVYTDYIKSEVANDQRQRAPKIMIYLDTTVQIEPTWRVRDSGGNYYNISKVMRPTLGRLIALEATSARTPASL
jgi:hypothetical protein